MSVTFQVNGLVERLFLYVVLCFAGYVGCLYPFYVLCTVLLKISSATIFDLCVLCANVYNLLFGLFLFNNVVSIFVCMHYFVFCCKTAVLYVV